MFNRPAARNAMTFAMYEQLVAICEQVDLDPMCALWFSPVPARRSSQVPALQAG
jgi:hypothetical protein